MSTKTKHISHIKWLVVVVFVVVVAVVFVVVENVEIRCLCWLRLSTERSVVAGPALELPRVQPASMARKPHRPKEKRKTNPRETLLPKLTEDEQLLARVTKEEAQLAQNKPDRIKGRPRYRQTQVRFACAGAMDFCAGARWSLEQEGRASERCLGEGGESHGELSEEEHKRCTW